MKLARYLKPYWFYSIISPLMMMCEVCADLCLPFLMSFIVDYGILENGLEEIKGSGIAYWIMKTLYGPDGITQIKIIIFLCCNSKQGWNCYIYMSFGK